MSYSRDRGHPGTRPSYEAGRDKRRDDRELDAVRRGVHPHQQDDSALFCDAPPRWNPDERQWQWAMVELAGQWPLGDAGDHPDAVKAVAEAMADMVRRVPGEDRQRFYDLDLLAGQLSSLSRAVFLECTNAYLDKRPANLGPIVAERLRELLPYTRNDCFGGAMKERALFLAFCHRLQDMAVRLDG